MEKDMTMILVTTPRMMRRTVPLSAAIATLMFSSQVAMAQDGMKAQAKSLASICRSDYDRLCKGVMPGGGRVVACLAEKAESLTPDCKAALPEAKSLASKAAASGAAPK
jgi:hypothetical protein